MNVGIKLVLYGAFLSLALFSGYKLKGVLSGQKTPVVSSSSTNRSQSITTTNLATNAPKVVGTLSKTNLNSTTNALSTNSLVPAVSETTGATVAASASDSTSLDIELSSTGALHRPNVFGGRKDLGFWIGCVLAGVIGCGVLLAYDFSRFTGQQAIQLMYHDDKSDLNDPDYERIEQQWAAGNHLDTIDLLRDYLQKHPREIHAAIRIAEIYEKDLKNQLAAALEYEEILKHKLNPDRWAWSAIHLCNLYFHLDQETKAVELLQRIIMEHGKMPAASKARKRLAEMAIPFADPEAEGFAVNTVQEEEPGPKLPPGFRRKK